MAETAATNNPLMDGADVPVVTFDVRLGRVFNNVEFDYAAYRQLALNMGANDEQIADFGMHFEYGRPWSFHGHATDSTMVVNVNRKSEDEINRWIIHETRHAIDAANGDFSHVERAQTVATNVLRLGSPVLAAAEVGVSLVGIISQDTQLGIPLISVGAAAISSVLAAKALYATNGSERRARRDAKGETLSVLTTTRKINP